VEIFLRSRAYIAYRLYYCVVYHIIQTHTYRHTAGWMAYYIVVKNKFVMPPMTILYCMCARVCGYITERVCTVIILCTARGTAPTSSTSFIHTYYNYASVWVVYLRAFQYTLGIYNILRIYFRPSSYNRRTSCKRARRTI